MLLLRHCTWSVLWKTLIQLRFILPMQITLYSTLFQMWEWKKSWIRHSKSNFKWWPFWDIFHYFYVKINVQQETPRLFVSLWCSHKLDKWPYMVAPSPEAFPLPAMEQDGFPEIVNRPTTSYLTGAHMLHKGREVNLPSTETIHLFSNWLGLVLCKKPLNHSWKQRRYMKCENICVGNF